MTRAIVEKAVGYFWPTACVLVVALAGFGGEVAAQQNTLGVSFGETANSFRNQSPGRRVTYVCPAVSANDAPVWGSSPYMDDSAVCVAAIHAGVLKENQPGIVNFVTGPDPGTYTGSTRNGVTTENWGAGRSFTFDSSGQPGVIDWVTTGQAIPVDFKQPIVVLCPPLVGMPDGAGTYGTDVYDDSSHICVAGVHVGAITAMGGPVQFTMAGNQSTFTGSTRNGVTTEEWGGGSTSFKVASTSGSSGGASNGVSGSVTGMVVSVDARGVPTVRWSAVPGATGYVVARWFVGDAGCCNNFSPPGAPLTTPTWLDGGTLPKLGTYGYRVYAATSSGTLTGETTFAWKGTTSGGAPTAAAKDPLAAGTLTPTVMATATSTVAAAPQTVQPVTVTPRYRVLLLGVQVSQTTKETPTTDGRGDEIYAAAVAVYWDRVKAAEISRTVVRTAEYGDVGAGIKTPDRIRAGTMSTQGGLTPGDVVPDGFVIPTKNSPSGNPSSSRFPLLVWEGTLTEGVDAVLIVPSVWERDSADTAYRRYEALWKIFPLEGVLKAPAVVYTINVPALALTTGNILVPATLITLSDLAGQIIDRPLGLTPEPLIEPYDDRYVVVTRDKLNALTAPGTSIDVPIEYLEPNTDPILGGDYTLYLRVERTQ